MRCRKRRRRPWIEEEKTLNPYDVLGVKPGASEEEIKKAYRSLVKKWHPDQYQNTPKHDEAVEKMKEINAAYDMLTGKNATPNFGQQGGTGYGGGYGQQGYAGQGQNATKEQVFQYVRMLLQMGDWRRAEMFLTQVQERTAEWHFLMGMIFWQSGRYDSARIHLTQAVQMDPSNAEYRQNKEQFEKRGTQFRGGRRRAVTNQDIFCCTLCALSSVSMCRGGGLPCMFFPFYC